MVCRYGGGGRGHMISNGQEGYGGPRQLMDRPWEEQRMQGGPGSRRTDGRTQPPSQQHAGPMQNGTNILAAVGQQVRSVCDKHDLLPTSGFGSVVHFGICHFDPSYTTGPLLHIIHQMLQQIVICSGGQQSCSHASDITYDMIWCRVCHMGTREPQAYIRVPL